MNVTHHARNHFCLHFLLKLIFSTGTDDKCLVFNMFKHRCEVFLHVLFIIYMYFDEENVSLLTMLQITVYHRHYRGLPFI